jgi:hypothetical protein
VLASTTYFGTSFGVRSASDDTLRTCFQAMRNQGLQFTVGMAAVLPQVPTGAGEFALEQPDLQRYISLGAPLAGIFIQEPLSVMSDTTATYADIVRETTAWAMLMRNGFPGLKLVLTEAYPSQPASKIVTFIRDVNAALRAAQAATLDGFELDQDWQVSRWSPGDLYAIHQMARSQGMLFSIILWPDGPDSTNDCDFGARIANQFRYLYTRGYLQYGQAFAPDMWTIESWDPIPKAILPEDGAGCSFMQAARAIVKFGI